jgi:hypothetical protein
MSSKGKSACFPVLPEREHIVTGRVPHWEDRALSAVNARMRRRTKEEGLVPMKDNVFGSVSPLLHSSPTTKRRRIDLWQRKYQRKPGVG